MNTPKKMGAKKNKTELLNYILGNLDENEKGTFIESIQNKKKEKKFFRNLFKNKKNKNGKKKENYIYIIFILLIIFIFFLLFKIIEGLNGKKSKNIYKFSVDNINNESEIIKGKNLNENNNSIFFKNINTTKIINSVIKETLEKNNTININSNSIIKSISINSINKVKVDKLLWNNEDIQLEKNRQEINLYNNTNISYKNIQPFFKRENPKISLIITVYNQENYLERVYASILNQSFTDIEIIFVDDASTDNSSIKIKEFMVKDKRIIYLKNDINRRTFYSRRKGIYASKGEYILIIDGDDFIINDILLKLYKTAKHYDLDILQYYMFIGKRLFREVKYTSGILYQPEIKDIFYYGKTRNLVDKLIRREIFIKSFEFMGNEYQNERFQIHDDDVCFYGLINCANSYGFLEQIGYFYNIGNPKSTMGSRFKPENMDNIFRSLFCIMKYFFEKSGNNTFEQRNVGIDFFLVKVKSKYKSYIKYLNKGFDFINNVLDLYLNSTFLNNKEKEDFISFKKEVNLYKTLKLNITKEIIINKVNTI